MKRGEVWLVNLDPTKGREQAGTRPCMILSVDPFNQCGIDLVIAIPITSTDRGWPTHVSVAPPEGGLTLQSFVKCEDIRSLSQDRLIKRLGVLSPHTTNEIEQRVRIVLGL